MDRIFLEGLELPCRIGCVAEERAIPRLLRADVSLFCASLATACADDSMDASVDFRIAGEMIAALQGREFKLIERVAEVLAEVALRHPRVQRVEVTVRKRQAVVGPDCVGVQITRTRA